MKIFLPFLSILLASITCLSQSYSSLAVFVSEEETGKPVPSASVIVKEAGWASKTTGSDGKAFFDKSMPVGEIHYIVSKEGFQGVEGAFNITTEEKSNSLNIKLSKFRDDRLLITGEVVDEEDRDLEGAIVEVKVADIVKTAKTDASGNYKIELTLNRTEYDVNTIKLEAKCKNGSGKKTETIELTRRNVIYKDFKIPCTAGEVPIITENRILASEKIDEIEVSITKIEQKGTKMTFYLTFENKSMSEKVRQYWIGSTGHILIDQDGVQYESEYARIGSISDQYVNLISGNIVKGQIEFEVSPTKIAKVQMLTVVFWNNFVFTNIKI
jgi:hypothetical protein